MEERKFELDFRGRKIVVEVGELAKLMRLVLLDMEIRLYYRLVL